MRLRPDSAARLAVALAIALASAPLPLSAGGADARGAAGSTPSVRVGGALHHHPITPADDRGDGHGPLEDHGPLCSWCLLLRSTAPEATTRLEPTPRVATLVARPVAEAPTPRSEPGVRSRAPPARG